jgi:hypothetical protein
MQTVDSFANVPRLRRPSELFQMPETIAAIMSQSKRARQDIETVLVWLGELARRDFLVARARDALTSVSVGDFSEHAGAIVNEFYSERVRDILRKARYDNVASLFLIEFDNHVRRSGTRLRREQARLDERLLPPVMFESRGVEKHGASGSGMVTPRRRISPRDRLLLDWAPGKHPTPDPQSDTEDAGDWVETTLFGPRTVPQGRHFMVQAYAHIPDQAAEAARLAIEFDGRARRLGFQTLSVKLALGMRLTFKLEVPGLDVLHSTRELVWLRNTAYVSFGVDVPIDQPIGDIVGVATVLVDGLPIGRITFKVRVKPSTAQTFGRMDTLEAVVIQANRYTMAFISYASQDRDTVLLMVRMLRIHGIQFFQDVINLEPGDRWSKELFRHIDECDLFLLFWSSHAKASEWVMKEALYALARQDGDDEAPPRLWPVVIEGPPPVLPPPELAHLHFDDPIAYFARRS